MVDARRVRMDVRGRDPLALREGGTIISPSHITGNDVLLPILLHSESNLEYRESLCETLYKGSLKYCNESAVILFCKYF